MLARSPRAIAPSEVGVRDWDPWNPAEGSPSLEVLNRMRRLADSPWVRTVLLRPPVRRAAARVAGLRFLSAPWQTDSPFRFIKGEIRRTDAAEYALRGTPVNLVVRHDVGAFELVDEVLRSGIYRPDQPQLDGLPEAPEILDLGANVGSFAAFSATIWPLAHITCVEPDPANLAALRRFVAINPSVNVTVLAACATARDGTVEFDAGGGAGSRIHAGGIPTPALDAFPLMSAADFIKCDIEGAEWELLRDPRMADIGRTLMVLEYHRRSPGDKGACEEAVRLLDNAGFTIGRVLPNYWGHGLIWASKAT